MRILLIVVGFAFLVLGLGMSRDDLPTVRVWNRSARPVASVTVVVGAQATVLPAVAPGAVIEAPLALATEGPLQVWVRFAGGGRACAKGGYFTPGMASRNDVAVLAADSLSVAVR
jgi:hypothetical protein